MKTYALDTHALVWFLTVPEKLGRRAKRALADVAAARAQGVVPLITLVEVSLLRERQRTRLNVAAITEAFEDMPQVRFLDLDLAQAEEHEALSMLIDPFDRMIVAAARCADAPLITADSVITGSGLVRVVWD